MLCYAIFNMQAVCFNYVAPFVEPQHYLIYVVLGACWARAGLGATTQCQPGCAFSRRSPPGDLRASLPLCPPVLWSLDVLAGAGGLPRRFHFRSVMNYYKH